MLGRLLRKGSSSSLHAGNQTLAPQDTPAITAAPSVSPQHNVNSFEDGYTRETLYGTSDPQSLAPIPFNRIAFRVIVSQDGGNLRSKQVLYDSAYSGTPLARNRLSTIHRPASELHDYIFGCGIPANECHSSSKIHLLPPLHAKNESQYAVLISKLFSLTETDGDDESCTPSWLPQLVLDTNRTVQHASTPSFDYKPTSKSHNLVHSRFAVAFTIPIESLDNLPTVVFNNWEEITHFLAILQRLVSKKLVALLNSAVREYVNQGNTCPYITNKRIQFPDLVLQQDPEVAAHLKKLVKLVHYNSNVPRLASTNLLMLHAAANPSAGFHPILVNWAAELINWLEFKDGKNQLAVHTTPHEDVLMSSTFLASLFATLMPLRHLLGSKPLEKGIRGQRDVVRVVIMTGNPTVAKKLIFIINGLIPDNRIRLELQHCRDVLDVVAPSNDRNRRTRYPPLPSPPEEASSNNFEPSFSKPQAMPIPIRGASATSDVSNSSLSRSITSRGWEIPHKCSASISTTPTRSKVETTAQTIPIKNNDTRRSLLHSASMAYLSSSLLSTLSSSASHYSLSKFGGSFMDKWKGPSLGTNMSSGFGSGVGSGIASGFGSYVDYPPDFDTGASLPKRGSIQSLRTPSPAIEHEEYNWNPTPRACRMFPIEAKDANNNELIRTTTGAFPTCKVGRKHSLIHVPRILNERRIKSKCQRIMLADFSVSRVSENTVQVETKHHDDKPVVHGVSLLPTAAFSDEFWPDFVLQSCPINPKLETHITTAMKNDLLFFKNSCNYERVSSRTVLVSLRVKEIKVFEMKTISSDVNEQATAYKTSVKRVFSPTKNHGNKELISQVENKFERLGQCLNTYTTKKEGLQELMEVVALITD